MRTRNFLLGALIGMMTVASAFVAEPAHAYWRGDIHRFHVRDVHVWRAGRWEHGWHDGRYAWWWLAAGTWYAFNRPVYPYPDPYVPPTVVINTTTPPPPAAPVMTAPPPPAPIAASQYWYYCGNPQGYYPYIPSCPAGWTPVPASPAVP